MAVISANISFKRGGHDLLDFSSKHNNYSTALTWAKDVNSNAAVGQFIYIEQEEIIDQTTYAKGAYIVEAIGTSAMLTPLSKSVAGGADLDVSKEIVDLKSKIDNIKHPKYTLVQLEKKSGMVASYQLAKDGVGLTDVTIDIPEDRFLQSVNFIENATSEEVAAAKQLGITINEGESYLKFVWNLAGENSFTTTYVSVNNLIDVYKSDGTYITMGDDGSTITLNITELDKLYEAVDVSDWNEETLNTETRSIQAKALKAKFGAMAEYIDAKPIVKKVNSLPLEKQDANVVYVLDPVGDGKSELNIWLGDKWLKLGDTIYYTKEEINAALKSKADKTYVDDNFLRQDASLTTTNIENIIAGKPLENMEDPLEK